MKVFISWSGTRSRETAKLLREWLPQILNEVEPWVSDDDLNVGGNWSGEIIHNLNEAVFGIICVTPGNRRKEWLNFEAGAISKSVGDRINRVAPFLIGFDQKSDLTGPLARFQAIQPTKDEMCKLLLSLNTTLTSPRALAAVDKALDVWWPDFETRYTIIEQSITNQPHSRRSDSDKIDELLQGVRSLTRKLDSSQDLIAALMKERRATRPDERRLLLRRKEGWVTREAPGDALQSFLQELPEGSSAELGQDALVLKLPEAVALTTAHVELIHKYAQARGLVALRS